MQLRHMRLADCQRGQLAKFGQNVFVGDQTYRETVFGLQRTATCSSRYRAVSSPTVGPSANLKAIGSGTGSSPALIRAMISAARRRASSAVNTP